MSCGNPHDVDCRDVLEQVYLYLDGELDEQERTAVRIHLDECGPCLRAFGIEQEVKLLIARCCAREPLPIGLQSKVLARLLKARTDLDHVEYRPK